MQNIHPDETYAVGSGPDAIAFDGTKIWVANDFAFRDQVASP